MLTRLQGRFTVLIASLVLQVGGSGFGADIIGASAGTGPVTSPDGLVTVSVTPRPVVHLASIGAADFVLLANTFPKWTFSGQPAGTVAPGTFNVLQYDPFALTTLGGANFSVIYNDGLTPPRTDLNWIQIAHPHNWGSFGNKPNVDSKFSNYPFYSNLTPTTLPDAKTPTSSFGSAIWTQNGYPQQKIQNPAGGGKVPAGDLIFVDNPFCSYSCIPPPDYAGDDFTLFLASFTWNGKGGANAGGTVSIYDGMEWGVLMTTSVPEPSTWVTSGLVVLGFVGFTWRRKCAAA